MRIPPIQLVPPARTLFLVGISSLVASTWLITSIALAASPVIAINQDAATVNVTGQALREHLSVLMGSGGNIGVLDGPGGLLLVDAGIAVSRPKIVAALSSISTKPVRFLINTHYHWDHTDGNEWLRAAGAAIIAHKNTLAHLSTATRVEDWDYDFPASPIGARPTVLVTAAKTLSFDGQTINIGYYGPAHTDGDLSVYFVQADVLLTGDTYWNGYYPFIDRDAGGSIGGMIRAAEANIKRAGDNTIVVPEHGPVARRADLVEYRDMLVTIRDSIASLKNSGKTLAEVIAARPTSIYDDKWGGFVIDPAFFTRLVYATL